MTKKKKIKGENKMKVMVSGTFNLLHAGHIEFFRQARSLGDSLVVTFCSESNLMLYKGYRSSMPDDNKQVLLEAIRYIDKVYKGSDTGGVWDFVPVFMIEKPDILAVTTDDKAVEEKRKFCDAHHTRLVVLPKTNSVTQMSSFTIAQGIKQS